LPLTKKILSFLSAEFDGLTNQINSLQKEFEYYLSWEKAPEKLLQAKKHQIGDMLFLMENNLKVTEMIKANENQNQDNLFKREACIFYHGINLEEYKSFIKKPVNEVVNRIKEAQAENYITIPEIFKTGFKAEFIDKPKQIKYTDKPVFDFNVLKQSAINARNQPQTNE